MIKGLLLAIAVMIMSVSGCIGLGPVGPDAPTNLIATSQFSQSNQVILTWNAVIMPQSTETITYNVYRGTIPGTISDKTKIASNISSPTYTDTSTSTGATYYYQVTAVDSTGESQASNQVVITIAENTSQFNLSAMIVSNRVVLNWYAFAGASGYNVYRSITKGVAIQFKQLIAPNVNAVTYTDTLVTSGITYYYQVTAITATGESPGSNEATVIAP